MEVADRSTLGDGIVNSHSRIFFVAHSCYLDASNGAAVASRAMLEALARRGFEVEVLCGAMLDLNREVDIAGWVAERHGPAAERGGGTLSIGVDGLRAGVPPHLTLVVGGVPVAVHRGPTTRLHEPEPAEKDEFLRLYLAALDRFRPEVVVGSGLTHRFQRWPAL